MSSKRFIVIGLIALAVACSSGKKEEAKPAMTKRQLDDAIAHSPLPGAGVVGKALEQSDSARARADRENAAFQ